MEDLHKPNCIRVFSGLYLNLLHPEEDMITIEDIAHGLSRQCRFAGHTTEYYTVAQHSTIMCELVPSKYALAALMHDASEAYLLDVPKPLKVLLPEYTILEDRLMRVISSKFNFEYPLHNVIHEADKELLKWEWSHLVLGEPLKNEFKYLTMDDAKKEFLRYFNQIKS